MPLVGASLGAHNALTKLLKPSDASGRCVFRRTEDCSVKANLHFYFRYRRNRMPFHEQARFYQRRATSKFNDYLKKSLEL